MSSDVRVKIHGIKNCDTMKKAFAWLDSHGVAYDFHDFKKLGVTEADLARWSDVAGWEKLLNRAGTSFRKLPAADQQDPTRDKAIALMVANPSMIKRPVLKMGDELEIGFKPERYAQIFAR
jgi:arsenate reductase